MESVAAAAPPGLRDALGTEPVAVARNVHDLLVEVADEATVRRLKPDLDAIAAIEVRAVVVTARSDDPQYDFVSRCFGPRVGINEDPVTGSAHCALGPYWGDKLYWYDPAITNHAAMDSKGRVWMSSRFRVPENQPAFCVGIDNLNDYYDVRLKEFRLDCLKKFKNFSFQKIDIENKTGLKTLFSQNQFDTVFNLAARAGVRASLPHRGHRGHRRATGLAAHRGQLRGPWVESRWPATRLVR